MSYEDPFRKERLIPYAIVFSILFIILFVLGYSIDKETKKYIVGADCFVVDGHTLGKIDSVINLNGMPVSLVNGNWYQRNEIKIIQ